MWHYFTLEDISNRTFGIYDILASNIELEEACQFTGLKDKNEKEIFEGDIEKEGGQVIWKEEDAMFGLTNGKYELGVYYQSIEIIGNIYENPELLNK